MGGPYWGLCRDCFAKSPHSKQATQFRNLVSQLVCSMFVFNGFDAVLQILARATRAARNQATHKSCLNLRGFSYM